MQQPGTNGRSTGAVDDGAFAGLLGQAKAKLLLGRLLGSGRVPHALLFRGPDGVGKQLFAGTMAAALNCRQSAGGQPCGLCPSCRKFMSGNHPDFIAIRPEQGTIKIGRVRELARELGYPPYESTLRVVLMEDVHTMRREAANCLLKTLEEPPENNLLILTAESSKSILSTIVSRCQIVTFSPLNVEDTVAILLEKETRLDRQTAALLAGLAEGSPGRALLFWRMEMVETWKKVINIITDSSKNPDQGVLQVLQAAEEMASMKENLLYFFGLLRIWIRDRLLLLGREQAGGAADPASGRKSAGLFDGLQAVDRAERELARNCNRTLVCEMLLFRLQKGQ